MCQNSGIINEKNNFIALEGKELVRILEEGLEKEDINERTKNEDINERTESDDLIERTGNQNTNEETRNNNHPTERIDNIYNQDSLIIYRATPAQKGMIASLMVKSSHNTLSIGDGNNDVPMLKDSHVWVGIMEKEGTQASLTADFAISEFKMLK